jgi:hypothetical protein
MKAKNNKKQVVYAVKRLEKSLSMDYLKNMGVIQDQDLLDESKSTKIVVKRKMKWI